MLLYPQPYFATALQDQGFIPIPRNYTALIGTAKAGQIFEHSHVSRLRLIKDELI